MDSASPSFRRFQACPVQRSARNRIPAPPIGVNLARSSRPGGTSDISPGLLTRGKQGPRTVFSFVASHRDARCTSHTGFRKSNFGRTYGTHVLLFWLSDAAMNCRATIVRPSGTLSRALFDLAGCGESANRIRRESALNDAVPASHRILLNCS